MMRMADGSQVVRGVGEKMDRGFVGEQDPVCLSVWDVVGWWGVFTSTKAAA